MKKGGLSLSGVENKETKSMAIFGNTHKVPTTYYGQRNYIKFSIGTLGHN